MPTSTPDEVLSLLGQAFNAGDLESILALYEPEATFVVQPGDTVTGTEALREAFSGFLALKPTFELEVKKVFRAGHIALSFADWTLTGTGPDGETMSMSGQGSDVLREQQDGRWLFVIDNPYGRVGAVSPGDI
jgi:uncharacterized protein (TIGR02246 family)